MFNFFKKAGEQMHKTEQEREEFLDGFRTGMPLVGQPEYPTHTSKAYRRGLRIGRREHLRAGSPEIPYEESEMMEE